MKKLTINPSLMLAMLLSIFSISVTAQKMTEADPCDTKFKLKAVAYEETTESSIYAIQFAFQFEENKDAPAWVEMQVRVTDCASNTRFVSIQLNYNQSTGMYTGALKLNQNKECPWGFSYAEITAYNRCKEKTSWSVEPVRKGNGLGTKNSSTKVSAKPQLL